LRRVGGPGVEQGQQVFQPAATLGVLLALQRLSQRRLGALPEAAQSFRRLLAHRELRTAQVGNPLGELAIVHRRVGPQALLQERNGTLRCGGEAHRAGHATGGLFQRLPQGACLLASHGRARAGRYDGPDEGGGVALPETNVRLSGANARSAPAACPRRTDTPPVIVSDDDVILPPVASSPPSARTTVELIPVGAGYR
jgi:hypothetical protein